MEELLVNAVKGKKKDLRAFIQALVDQECSFLKIWWGMDDKNNAKMIKYIG